MRGESAARVGTTTERSKLLGRRRAGALAPDRISSWTGLVAQLGVFAPSFRDGGSSRAVLVVSARRRA